MAEPVIETMRDMSEADAAIAQRLELMDADRTMPRVTTTRDPELDTLLSRAFHRGFADGVAGSRDEGALRALQAGARRADMVRMAYDEGFELGHPIAAWRESHDSISAGH